MIYSINELNSLLVVVFPYMLNSAGYNFAWKSQILRFIYHKLEMHRDGVTMKRQTV